jgi:23S rRNA pseudouridine1911/1915/1917 synthase
MDGRLDAVVRRLRPDLSRRLVRTLVAEGAIRVNGRPAAKGASVREGDVLELPELEGIVPDPRMPLHVLYEDEAMIAVDKPGGVHGHALDPRQRGTVAGALVARYPELTNVGDPLSAGLVHRLDTGTSGVLVAARSAASHAALRARFRAHDVVKRYVAIVDGVPAAGTVVDVALAHDSADRRRMRAARAGDRAWPARTVVDAVEPHGDRARVEIEIRTGVTHQVRAHLALLGHPILGDVLYGGPPAAIAPGRHALHAAALDLPGSPRLRAPLPADLEALLRR